MARIRVPDRYRLADGQIDTAAIKDDVCIADVVRRFTPRIGGSGDGLSARCPMHEDHTPSLSVTPSTGLWYCHACKVGGDVIDFVRLVSKVSFHDACEWLVGANDTVPPAVRMSSIEAAERRARNREVACREWRMAGPVAGTPGDLYLASRGLAGNVPPSIRYGEVPRWWDRDSGAEGTRLPCLLSACQDVDGRLVGIQRLFLDQRGRKRAGPRPRLCLGQIRGGALRLGPEASEIHLTEGVEDGLAIARMFPGAIVWVALGSANLAHVALPPITRRVVIAADGDEPGLDAADAARVVFEARDVEVEIIRPRAGAKDFAEEWMLLHA